MRRRGFTLLEVLIAVGLLGGALVAVLGSVHHATAMQRAAVAYLDLAAVSEGQLAAVLALKDLRAGASDSGKVHGRPGLSWSYAVEEVVLPFWEAGRLGPKSPLLKVRLEVRDTGTPQRSLTLTEYVSRGVAP